MFNRMTKELNLPRNASLSASPFYENCSLHLTLAFSSVKELKSYADNITELAHSPKIKKYFDNEK